MGCYESLELVNSRLKSAVNRFDYKTIHQITSKYKASQLDQSLINDAAKSGHVELIEILLMNSKLNLEFNVKEVDTFGKSPIDYALEFGFYNIGYPIVSRYLLLKGATLNSNKHSKFLFSSAEKGKLEIIKLLLENKFDINMIDENGETPLFKAALNNCFGIFKFLHKNGAKLDITNKEGKSLREIVNNSKNELLKNYYFDCIGSLNDYSLKFQKMNLHYLSTSDSSDQFKGASQNSKFLNGMKAENQIPSPIHSI